MTISDAAGESFRLRRRGSVFAAAVCSVWGIMAVAFLALGVKAGVALIVNEPGPGEGGRPASLGFLVVFAGLAFLGAEYALRGGRTVLVACRRPGNVEIDGDLLTIAQPGLLDRPLTLHRTWVDSAEQTAGAEVQVFAFTLTTEKRVTVIRLNRPVELQYSLAAPRLPYDDRGVPDSTNEIILDIERGDEATRAIDEWAHRTSITAPEPPRRPFSQDARVRTGRLIAYGVITVALASMFFTLPS